MKRIAATLLAALTLLTLTGTAEAKPPHRSTSIVLDDPAGSWQPCVWNGVRWNAPCVYDHRHPVQEGESQSYLLFPDPDGYVRPDYVSHRVAHYLLGK